MSWRGEEARIDIRGRKHAAGGREEHDLVRAAAGGNEVVDQADLQRAIQRCLAGNDQLIRSRAADADIQDACSRLCVVAGDGEGSSRVGISRVDLSHVGQAAIDGAPSQTATHHFAHCH